MAEGRREPKADTGPFGYTLVSVYVDRIMQRSEERGWGFDGKQADMLRTQLAPLTHIGPRQAVSVGIWRGRDLTYNLGESIAWLRDELAALGVGYDDRLRVFGSFDDRSRDGIGNCSFLPGSEMSGEPSLVAIGLSIDSDKLEEFRAMRWPGLEVIDFFCLNPQMLERFQVTVCGLLFEEDAYSWGRMPLYLAQVSCALNDSDPALLISSTRPREQWRPVRYRQL